MASQWTRGNFVWLPWPFTDWSSTKGRPALVIASNLAGSSDFIGLMVTTQCRSHGRQYHVIVDESAPGFRETGLARTSCIRCDRIYTFDGRMVKRLLGRASPQLMKEVGDKLVAILGLSQG